MRRLLRRASHLSISLLFFAADVAWRWACRCFGKVCEPHWVVLYYHSVPSEQACRFSKQMDLLIKLTTPIAITALAECTGEDHYSSVTFDDVFQNVLDNAVPELVKREIPAAMFVTTGLLGQAAKWWPADSVEAQQKIVSAAELRDLPPHLITVGSHTVNHPMLTLLSETEARRELSSSKSELRRILERDISSFSFPYSVFNQQLAQLCHEVGYTHVFGGQTISTSNAGNVTFSVIGRISADPADWELEFGLKLLGAYRWMPYAIALKRAILSNWPVRDVRSALSWRSDGQRDVIRKCESTGE